MSPKCSGNPPCVKGRPHDVSAAALLESSVGQKLRVKLLSGKVKTAVAPCGARVRIGPRSRSKFRKMQSTSAAPTLSLTTIWDALMNTFSDLAKDLKAPGTYFYDGDVPVVFKAVHAGDHFIVTIELFNPKLSTRPDIVREVNNFIQPKMVKEQGAHLVQLSEEAHSLQDSDSKKSLGE